MKHQRSQKSRQNLAHRVVLHPCFRSGISCARHQLSRDHGPVQRKRSRSSSPVRRGNSLHRHRRNKRSGNLLLDLLGLCCARHVKDRAQSERIYDRCQQRKHPKRFPHRQRRNRPHARTRRRNYVLPQLRTKDRQRLRILQALRRKTITHTSSKHKIRLPRLFWHSHCMPDSPRKQPITT